MRIVIGDAKQLRDKRSRRSAIPENPRGFESFLVPLAGGEACPGWMIPRCIAGQSRTPRDISPCQSVARMSLGRKTRRDGTVLQLALALRRTQGAFKLTGADVDFGGPGR
jgi:hypothetical protein